MTSAHDPDSGQGQSEQSVFEQPKNLKHFFTRILLLSACIPLCIALFFLVFILRANSEKISENYKQQEHIIEYGLTNTFAKIADSLNTIADNKEISFFLNHDVQNSKQSEEVFSEFLQTVQEKQQVLNYDYCLYQSNSVRIYGNGGCPTLNSLQKSGIQYLEKEKSFALYKTYFFASDFGEYPLVILASIPFSALQKQFQSLQSVTVNSDNLTNIQLKVHLSKNLFDSAKIEAITFVLLGCMLFLIISIFFGTRFSYLLKQKAEDSLKLAIIGKTAHFLAHDIKKPFQHVAYLQKELTFCKTKEEVNALIQTTQTALSHSKNLIEQTLQDLSDVGANMLNIKLHLSLQNLIQHTIDALLTDAKKPDLKSRFSLEFKHTLYLNADEGKLSRALLNLISNAIDAIKTKPNANIVIKTFDTNNQISISIQNTESSISKENIKRIFEPFFTTKGSHGTGLGLSTTKKMIALHKGSVECISSQNSVEFIVQLPGKSGNTVVVIDDCPLTLKSWKRYFHEVIPSLTVKTFLSYEEFFSWNTNKNDKNVQITEIISDYSFHNSNLSIQDALTKTRQIYQKEIYMATHMNREMIQKELQKFNVVFIKKNQIKDI